MHFFLWNMVLHAQERERPITGLRYYTRNVGNAFLYMATDAEWEQAKPRLLLCMEHFLSGFSDDGACLEGYTYWQYGFGYFYSLQKHFANTPITKKIYLLLSKYKTLQNSSKTVFWMIK